MKQEFTIIQFADGKYGAYTKDPTSLLFPKKFLDMKNGKSFWVFDGYIDKYCKSRFLWIVKWRIKNYHKRKERERLRELSKMKALKEKQEWLKASVKYKVL